MPLKRQLAIRLIDRLKGRSRFESEYSVVAIKVTHAIEASGVTPHATRQRQRMGQQVGNMMPASVRCQCVPRLGSALPVGQRTKYLLLERNEPSFQAHLKPQGREELLFSPPSASQRFPLEAGTNTRGRLLT